MNMNLAPLEWNQYIELVNTYDEFGTLHFENTPNQSSPPYVSPGLDADPNGGHMALDTQNPENTAFLHVQLQTWRWIQKLAAQRNSSSKHHQRYLVRKMDHLDSIKCAQWNAQRVGSEGGYLVILNRSWI
ncbi:hypothetical protein PIIN_08583 [Serendipita indica DSM 11827]|uniref:Uncharacterized protein n=1 Tax=Serendipita indica (strain DSM 11827) TaxID=1109443 RepID=G4TTI8_SERID|nr:hypothetical protein PIIN_08583 [Serendipita indica DSM 11827]